jgi:anion-transporting  ArsA/GET3 family ATPase
MASRPFYQVADRILGSQFLEDIAEFFILFQTMYDGFVERAQSVSRLLRDRRTTFLVVSTLEASPLHEAEFFIDALTERKLQLGAVVLNRVLPEYLLDESASDVASAIESRTAEIAAVLAPEAGDAASVERVLSEIAASFLNFEVVAQREAEQRAELAVSPEVVATVPLFDTDIADMRGLLRLGESIWG